MKSAERGADGYESQRYQDGEEYLHGQPLKRLLLWESLRSCATRPTFVAGQSSGFILLVAIQFFDAPAALKALIAGAVPLGLLMSMVVVNLSARWRISVSRALSLWAAISAVGLFIAAFGEGLESFVIGVFIGIPAFTSSAPLVTALWRQKVDQKERGRYFAWVNVLMSITALIASLIFARVLDLDIENYRLLLGGLGLLMLFGAWAGLQIESRPLATPARNPLANLSLLRSDPLFGWLNLGWFVMGIANLAILPFRTEFVASAEYGLQYSPARILLLTMILPQGLSMISTVLWGKLFDRFGFLRVRIVLNFFFLVSMLSFFQPGFAMQVVGSVCLGIAFGGGAVIWSLWVTEIASPERTADYMSVHSSLTGIRGLLGPIIAYAAIDFVGLELMTHIAAGLIMVSIGIFAWIMRRDTRSHGRGEKRLRS